MLAALALLRLPAIISKYLPKAEAVVEPVPMVIARDSARIDTGLTCHVDPAALVEFAWTCGEGTTLQVEVKDASDTSADPDHALRRMARALNDRRSQPPVGQPIFVEGATRLLVGAVRHGVALSTQREGSVVFVVVSGTGDQAPDAVRSVWRAMSGRPLPDEQDQQVARALKHGEGAGEPSLRDRVPTPVGR